MQTVIHDMARSDAFFMRAIGGESGLNAFIEEAGQAEAQPCPCCKTQPAVRVQKALSILAISVFCPACELRTKRYSTGTNVLGETFTPSDRLQRAVTEWNSLKGGKV